MASALTNKFPEYPDKGSLMDNPSITNKLSSIRPPLICISLSCFVTPTCSARISSTLLTTLFAISSLVTRVMDEVSSTSNNGFFPITITSSPMVSTVSSIVKSNVTVCPISILIPVCNTTL